jgi:hypothetical protein
VAAKKRNTRRPGPSTKRARPASTARKPAESRAARVPEPQAAPVGFPGWESIVAAGVGVGAAALFLDTVSSHVALGDAPESVIGVRTLGILHAPGYPAYVLAAKAFGSIFAVGGWALRVNLFSVVCAALVVVATYLLARRLGASPAGAAIGSFAFASSSSFWFNAAFAKHYAFSALLVTASALLVVMWQRGGASALLIAAGALIGAGLGSAWQLAAIMALGLVVLVATGSRRPDVRVVVGAAAGLVVVALAVWCFVLVRAHQDPLLNWGDATNASRLLALIKQQDFGATGARSVSPGRVGAAVGGLVRDFGAGAIALAVVGAAYWWRRVERGALWFLAVIGLVNLAAVILFAGFPSIQGFATGLVQGGYLIDTMLVIAVLASLGATTVITEIGNRASAVLVVPVTIIALVGVTIVPSVLVHHKYANMRVPPFADDYGQSVLAELPPHSVLMVWGEEFSFPIIYRQVVDHERPDVTVLSVNGIGLDWVREQLTRRLDLGSALSPTASTPQLVLALIAKLKGSRPVFLDTNAMIALTDLVGYRTRGLVGEVVGGVGPHPISDPAAVSARLERSEDQDGLIGRPSNRIPYRTIFYFYERAHIELAKVSALAGDLTGATNELQRAVSIFPSDTGTATALARLRGPGGRDSLSAVKNL